MAESSRAHLPDSERLIGTSNYGSKLLLQDRDCWEGIIVNPIDHFTGEDPADLKTLLKRRIRAMALMSRILSSSPLSAIRTCEGNPKDVWDHLQRRYGSHDPQRKIFLTTRLALLRMGTSSVEVFLRDFDNIVAQLSAIGHSISETDLIYIALNALPHSWGPFVSVFAGELSRPPAPTYSQFVSRMQSEEQWRAKKTSELEAEASALAVTEFCNYCWKPNHWESECELKSLDDQIVRLQLHAANLLGECG